AEAAVGEGEEADGSTVVDEGAARRDAEATVDPAHRGAHLALSGRGDVQRDLRQLELHVDRLLLTGRCEGAHRYGLVAGLAEAHAPGAHGRCDPYGHRLAVEEVGRALELGGQAVQAGRRGDDGG